MIIEIEKKVQENFITELDFFPATKVKTQDRKNRLVALDFGKIGHDT